MWWRRSFEERKNAKTARHRRKGSSARKHAPASRGSARKRFRRALSSAQQRRGSGSGGAKAKGGALSCETISGAPGAGWRRRKRRRQLT